MNEYIIMADQTTIQNAYVVPRENNSIVVYVNGQHTFSEISAIFADSAKVRTMESHQYGDVHTWNGYTVITNLQIEANRAIVCLFQS